MAATTKKVLKRNISTDVIPLNEQTWLIQPLQVTMMRYDYTTSQNKILAAMVQELQSSIRDVINNVSSPDTLPLFTATHEFGSDVVTDNEIILKIPTKRLILDRRRFSEYMEALKSLATTPISMPIKDKQGKSYTEYSGLCTVILPKNYRNGEILIKIKKDVALRMIDTKNGFTSYIKEVIDASKNKYEQRFYWLISSWKDRGATNPISIKELRQLLRLEKEYPRWNMFNTKVIEAARVRLLSKAEAGEVDCYFEPEYIYKGTKKRGEPEAIRLHIYQSEAGREAMSERGFISQKIKVEEFMRNTFEQSATNVRTISALLTSENVAEFSRFLTDLEAKMKEQGAKIRNLRAWSMDRMKRFFARWDEKRQAEMLHFMGESDTPAMQSSSENVANALFTDAQYAKWVEARATMRTLCAEAIYTTWFEPLRLQKVEDNFVYVEAPSEFVRDMVKQNYPDAFVQGIEKGFGIGTDVDITFEKYKCPK